TVPAMLIPVADRQPACPGPSVAPGTTVLQVPVDGVDDGPLGAGNRQSVLLKTFTLGNEIPTALAAQVRIAVHRHLAALSAPGAKLVAGNAFASSGAWQGWGGHGADGELWGILGQGMRSTRGLL